MQPLNAIRAALAIPKQGMKGKVGVAVVAVRTGTGVTCSANSLAFVPWVLAFMPGQNTRLLKVAADRRGMRASTHGTIVGSGGLRGRSVLRLGDETETGTG